MKKVSEKPSKESKARSLKPVAPSPRKLKKALSSGKNIEDEFLIEMDANLKHSHKLEIRHRTLQVCLMVIIAACGFLTAAASQSETNSTWVSAPTSLLVFGLLSAVCAIINQVITPGEKYTYHQNKKRALQYIIGEVKYRDMTVSDAEHLRALAVTSPELVLGKLKGAYENDVKP